jgi:hypothetical protein
MQHLLVHLPYEAKIAGPVQYRWMYHIERALKKLSAMVAIKEELKDALPKNFSTKRYNPSQVYTLQRNTM